MDKERYYKGKQKNYDGSNSFSFMRIDDNHFCVVSLIKENDKPIGCKMRVYNDIETAKYYVKFLSESTQQEFEQALLEYQEFINNINEQRKSELLKEAKKKRNVKKD